MSKPPEPRDSISHRYFRRVFRWFIGFAVLLTMVLVAETLWQGRDKLQTELTVYQRSFERSIAGALWALDWDKLNSIAVGMVEIPAIRGVRILDPGGSSEILRIGALPDPGAEIRGYGLTHRFDLIHEEGFVRERIGVIELHSSFDQVFERSQRQISLILLLGLVKTLVLWWIFLTVGRRLIAKPLTEMVEVLADAEPLRPMRLSDTTRKAIDGTELGALQVAYDRLIERVQTAQKALEDVNCSLEERVRERTLELERANDKLEQLAHTDPLTGLPNRRQFIAAAQTLIALSRRSGRPLVLIVCDIDAFKRVNDVHGHTVGDQAICYVADCLRRAVREIDVVARFGGDEFVLLLPDVSAAEALAAAERVRQLVSGSWISCPNGERLRVTLSLGIAEWATGDVRLEDLFLRADERLYRAKAAGRNCTIADDTNAPSTGDPKAVRSAGQPAGH